MKRIFIIAITVFACKSSFAQISIERQVIGSTGSYTDAGTVKASSTVGEAVIPTYSQSSLVFTQGFQQPVSSKTSIDIFTGIHDIMPDGASITAYPNPTSGRVVLDITMKQPVRIEIDIYNAIGQLAEKQFLQYNDHDMKELD